MKHAPLPYRTASLGRVIECTDALTGIEDPVSVIQATRELLEAVYIVHRTITTYATQSPEDKEANEAHCARIQAVLQALTTKP